MRRSIGSVLAAAFLAVLAGCGEKASPDGPKPSAKPAPAAQQAPAATNAVPAKADPAAEAARAEALAREVALAEAKARGEAAAKLEAEAAAKAAEEAKKAEAALVKKAAEERAAEEKAAAEEAKKAAEAAKAEKAEREKREAEEKVERAEVARSISTRVFQLHHVSAAEVAEKFNKTWSGEFGEKWKVTQMAQAFEESNSVMVTAPNRILEACAAVIAEIDREARQVYIEARFVELGNSASHKVGIDWAMLNGIDLKANGGIGLQKTVVGNAVTEYGRTLTSKTDGTTTYKVSGSGTGKSVLSGDSDDGKISYFNGTLSVSEMSMTLKALDSSGDTKTFSNPKIIVSSGKKATVDMTTKYPNVKISAKRTEASASTSLDIAANMEAIPGEDKFMFAKESFFSWGISLEVTPRIGTNGLINVSIVPTISSLDSWVETGTGASEDAGTVSSKYPVIKVQRLISEFNLESGTTAVIGGLSVTDEAQRDTGIPVLRQIPWVGTRFFGSTERVKEQKEIIVFVTVGLVNPRAMDATEGLPKNAVLGRQYTKGQKLEPGDRPEKNMEGFDSLDMRPLEDQAKDPLRQRGGFNFGKYIPFTKDPNYTKEEKK